ncbi:MAG: ComF family protein, partial [Candidatus Dormibacteria bacterium]
MPRVTRVDGVQVHAAFRFEGAVREALHRGKFEGDRGALRELARLTAQRLHLQSMTRPDAVVAVPLGTRRGKHRGYNQAEIIAAELASAVNVPLVEGLVRVRETPPQSRRGERSRRLNLEGALEWRGPALERMRLWLVDDVVTTGATTSAAATALRAS